MIKRLNLPALTLPDPAHDSSGVEYMSSIINYTAWALASDTLTQLNNNVLNEIMINSHQRYQEADNTKNGRIFTTESRWRILYMIDPAGTVLHAHDAADNITETITCAANSWYLIDSHVKNSSSGITGTQKALTINHLNDFSASEQTWIDGKIL
tara:strand:+ start:585 stop:1046 length:462 start_codon:yes stop_codon:yes gene_type:complete